MIAIPEPMDHWNNLHQRCLTDADVLLQSGRDSAAALVLTTLIDAAAGYYTGRDQERGVERSWQEFANAFLPEFTRVRFGDLVFSYADSKDIPVRDTAHLLYCCFRNGLVHEGGLPNGFRLIRSSDDPKLQYRVSAADGAMEINILALHSIVTESCRRFTDWLNGQPEAPVLYRKRLSYHARHRFRKTRTSEAPS